MHHEADKIEICSAFYSVQNEKNATALVMMYDELNGV